MRHRVAGKKLNRDSAHRKALRRNLMNAILLSEDELIITTPAKAKAMRGELEKLITKAKRAIATGDEARGVHARRIILARLGNNRDAMFKIYDDLAPRYEDRPGGYTRIYKLNNRRGDDAQQVMLQLMPAGDDA